MIIHQYVPKAAQDDAQLAGVRNRLLLEAWPVRMARAASAWFPPLRCGGWPGCCSAGRLPSLYGAS